MKLRLYWKGHRFGLPYDEYLIKSFSFDGEWLHWVYFGNHQYDSGETKLSFISKFEVVL